jgi:hypothetical protein
MGHNNVHRKQKTNEILAQRERSVCQILNVIVVFAALVLRFNL